MPRRCRTVVCAWRGSMAEQRFRPRRCVSLAPPGWAMPTSHGTAAHGSECRHRSGRFPLRREIGITDRKAAAFRVGAVRGWPLALRRQDELPLPGGEPGWCIVACSEVERRKDPHGKNNKSHFVKEFRVLTARVLGEYLSTIRRAAQMAALFVGNFDDCS